MSLKKFRYIIETIFVKFGLYFFNSLSIQRSSNFAGNIAMFIGNKISVNKLATNNLAKAMPLLSDGERKIIINSMWNNLGKIIGEYIHISKYSLDEIEKVIVFSEQSQNNINYLKETNRGGIIFSGHLGNWEIGPKALMTKGLKVNTLYRPLNNPYVEKITADLRKIPMIKKSLTGGRKIIEAIKRGEFVIILADQKISEGEPVKFFHDKAITTTSIARMAIKYNIPIIPARSIRLNNDNNKIKFSIEVEKPLKYEISKNIEKDVLGITLQINQKLEEWIRQFPDQWFWVHNRWKK